MLKPKYFVNLKKKIKIFYEKLSEGPLYMPTCI